MVLACGDGVVKGIDQRWVEGAEGEFVDVMGKVEGCDRAVSTFLAKRPQSNIASNIPLWSRCWPISM